MKVKFKPNAAADIREDLSSKMRLITVFRAKKVD
jgi:hypothetical protein